MIWGNIELASNDEKIIFTYYTKLPNVIASGKGQQIIICENNKIANNTINHAMDIDKEAKVIVYNQRLYNRGLYDDYKPRSIVMDMKGKGIRFTHLHLDDGKIIWIFLIFLLFSSLV